MGSNPGPATSQLHDLGQATYLVCTSVSCSADGDEIGPTSNTSGEDESCERRLHGECSSISSGCNMGWEMLPQPGLQVPAACGPAALVFRSAVAAEGTEALKDVTSPTYLNVTQRDPGTPTSMSES